MKKLFLALAMCLMLTANVNASQVNVWSDWYDPTVINNFYNGLSGVTSSIITGDLNTNNLSGVKLLWAIQPADSYTAAELSTMATFLSNGGRIAFMGEHGGYAPDQNSRITAAIAALGGHISINTDAPDPGLHVATRAGGQILTHTLTTGVDSYGYACFASLNLSGAAEALMLGSNLSDIMMGYENIGPGSIFLITDQNVWDVAFSSGDNARMFENLLVADTGAPPVSAVPEPSTIALLGFGLASIGFFSRRRK